jgi:hypothetical protein
MRVIRTELYNDEVSHEFKLVTTNLGIGCAWFNTGELAYPVLELVSPIAENASNEVDRFLDVIVQGSERRDFQERLYSANIVNRPIVDYLKYEFPIVVEQSPPLTITLAQLLKNASSTTIGTLLGVAAAGENYPLMFITVPAGIIVVGSAYGVSKGLEAGLAKRIEKLMKWKPK